MKSIDRRELAILVAGVGLALTWLLFVIAVDWLLFVYGWSLALSDFSDQRQGYPKLAVGWLVVASLTGTAWAAVRVWLGKSILPRRGSLASKLTKKPQPRINGWEP